MRAACALIPTLSLALTLTLTPNPNQVAELVNTYESDGAKEAVKALKRRLGLEPRVLALTLTLLESLMKNCSASFHVEVAHTPASCSWPMLTCGASVGVCMSAVCAPPAGNPNPSPNPKANRWLPKTSWASC